MGMLVQSDICILLYCLLTSPRTYCIETIKWLITYFKDNYTALHIAVESCKPAVVETLLGYGADVHIRGGKQRETALHIAARTPDGKFIANISLSLVKSFTKIFVF